MHCVWSVWGFETRDSLDILVSARRGSACKKVGFTRPCQLGPAVAQGKARAKKAKQRCEGVNRAEELGSMCVFRQR